MTDILKTRLVDGLARMQLAIEDGKIDRLITYIKLLKHWNKTYNLTAVRQPEAMIDRHLLDSLSLLPYLEGQNACDLGSGAGLPGLVLAICAPECYWSLVDSNGKKARFLRAVVRELELANVKVIDERVEKLTGKHDLITARAFASLGDMLTWGGHLLAENGYWLAMKGHIDPQELATIPACFRYQVKALDVPNLSSERHVVILQHAAKEASRSPGSGHRGQVFDL